VPEDLTLWQGAAVRRVLLRPPQRVMVGRGILWPTAIAHGQKIIFMQVPFMGRSLVQASSEKRFLLLIQGTRMRLLVVEDDPDLNRQLTTALTDAGYVVDRAFDGEEGHFLGDSEPYDAVVLDIGLPKMDGISVLEAWRRNGRGMPVLILTARDRWSDKVQGFDAGADDYVAKPFHLEEVLARIRALLRRSTGHAQSELSCGPVTLDTRTGRVSVSGNPVKMTSHEYRLLAYLMHHAGRVVSRTELVEHLYDQDFDRDSNTIEVFVGRIRKKLDVDIIQTVRGLGYLLTPPPAAG